MDLGNDTYLVGDGVTCATTSTDIGSKVNLRQLNEYAREHFGDIIYMERPRNNVEILAAKRWDKFFNEIEDKNMMISFDLNLVGIKASSDLYQDENVIKELQMLFNHFYEIYPASKYADYKDRKNVAYVIWSLRSGQIAHIDSFEYIA